MSQDKMPDALKLHLKKVNEEAARTSAATSFVSPPPLITMSEVERRQHELDREANERMMAEKFAQYEQSRQRKADKFRRLNADANMRT